MTSLWVEVLYTESFVFEAIYLYRYGKIDYKGVSVIAKILGADYLVVDI